MNRTKTLLALSLLVLMTTTYAVYESRPEIPRMSVPTATPSIDESTDIRGVITSIKNGRMTIKADNGQIYVFPVTKSITGRELEPGTRVVIKVHCSFHPLRCTMEVVIEL